MGQSVFKVEVVARGLQVPWAMVFAPDGRLIFTERVGRVRVIEKGRLREKPLAEIADCVHRGEGGLMGLALHPNFARTRWLYLAYLYEQGGLKVRVVRYRETGDALVEPKVIIEGIQGNFVHDGTALGFGPDGKLYITTGDAAQRELAQRLDRLEGKTLRLNDDGSIPSDNPFVKTPNARPEIWSYGHRNAQGMDWQPGTGLMFQTEHGPSGFDGPGGGDEVNIVERGRNYGWPVIHHRQTRAGMEAPLLEFTPAVAPGACAFYRGNKIPQWRHNLFVACLRGQKLIRVVLEGRRVVKTEDLLVNEYGRLRAVASGPDGFLYVSTSNRDGRGRPHPDDDRILRLVPA
ncbi:MAG: PQQ-dependent sugar dehydrogenase [Fimbriimonadales bacterium]|jgi:glucose/arabinose dehydrogenase|nr:PQQ-dependent sugar dehydrogenase [Fimbriimonadales bacterium]GBC89386.1 Aldose sugar dehydrogenase YliI [bacterium HR14]GIV12407.1 MAG: oxidoreductase [Fimbriimonadales bacterium]CUU03795.1 Glucose/arabinose dehydrogenase, beta-propeller fold [Armatimonadetes bacterium GBS]CUU33831.1 Glucose/arabinose dehydrogenase, beta-propeller fold [Armatimonadetes bacterium GXS]